MFLLPILILAFKLSSAAFLMKSNETLFQNWGQNTDSSLPLSTQKECIAGKSTLQKKTEGKPMA